MTILLALNIISLREELFVLEISTAYFYTMYNHFDPGYIMHLNMIVP